MPILELGQITATICATLHSRAHSRQPKPAARATQLKARSHYRNCRQYPTLGEAWVGVKAASGASPNISPARAAAQHNPRRRSMYFSHTPWVVWAGMPSCDGGRDRLKRALRAQEFSSVGAWRRRDWGPLRWTMSRSYRGRIGRTPRHEGGACVAGRRFDCLCRFDVTSGRQGRRGTTQQIREHHPVPAHASNPQRLEREL